MPQPIRPLAHGPPTDGPTVLRLPDDGLEHPALVRLAEVDRGLLAGGPAAGTAAAVLGLAGPGRGRRGHRAGRRRRRLAPRRWSARSAPASAVQAWAWAATFGWASSASMVSSPWMALSAPLLWLIVAVGLQAVEGDAGGRVVHRLARPVGAEEPARPAWRPAASSPGRSVASAMVSRFCTRESTPYAIWVRSIGVGSQPLSGPPAAIRVGSKLTASATAGRSSRGWSQDDRAPGQRAAHLRGPGVPQRPRLGPGQDRPVRPGPSDRCPSRRRPSSNWRSTRRAFRSRGAAST